MYWLVGICDVICWYGMVEPIAFTSLTRFGFFETDRWAACTQTQMHSLDSGKIVQCGVTTYPVHRHQLER